MKKHVVAKGRAIHWNGQVIEEGADVTGMPFKNMVDHIKSGFVVELDTPDPLPEEQRKFVEPIASDQDLAVQGTKLQAVGKWALDPKALKGKTLDQLNVMVKERDAQLKPFEKTEDAIERLSSDFRPAPAPLPKK